jgi:hypothetical protein
MIRELVVFILLLTAALSGQQVKGARKTSVEPFDSFQAIDRMLSVLDAQINRADSVIAKAGAGAIATTSGKKIPQPWGELSQQMSRNVQSLQARAGRMERRYRKAIASKSIFPPLLRSAAELRHSAKSFQAAKDSVQAKAALERLRKSRISFVLSLHALTSDYGALRCQQDRWACCDVTRQDGGAVCRWTCVDAPRRCSKGLLGPKSKSASTEVIRR